MAVSPRLELRQSQSLVMTPQLMQSIRLHQMPHAELERFIDSEIEKNPLVEREEVDTAGEAPAPESENRPIDGFTLPDGFGPSAVEMADTLDSSLENIFPDEPGREEVVAPDLAAQWKSAAGSGHAASDGDGFDIAALAPARLSLGDHVGEQIAFAFTDPGERRLAAELAGHLDENGYLRTDAGEIASMLGLPAASLEAVLETLQQFDPPGIFARSLSECLAIQLRRKDRFDPAMEALIANLELLARRDFAALRRLCGVGEADLVDMLGEIRALDPKPGAAFAIEPSEAIVPDVTVRPARDGTWDIELNAAALPRVLVDQSYYATVARKASAPEKEFLSECLQSANWLVRSLDQRARTILKVATEIVRRQDGFLANGITHMRPLNLRMVADEIS